MPARAGDGSKTRYEMRLFAALSSVPLALLLTACQSASKPDTISSLAEEFTYSTLAMSPVAATASGYHEHYGVRLDDLLDDFSPKAMQKYSQYFRAYEKRLGELETNEMSPDERADYHMLRDQVALTLLELEMLQQYRHDPAYYLELLGMGLMDCYVRDFAPEGQRFRSIISRLNQAPGLLAQAKANLVDAPAVWNRIAREELTGNIRLIKMTLREAAPPELRAEYDAAAAKALAALNAYDEFLENDLSRRTSDWRLGPEKYAWKFRYRLSTDTPPEQILREAEHSLDEVRREMYELALPLYRSRYPGAADTKNVDAVIEKTLEKISEKRATRETYLAEVRRDLDEITRFVETHNLAPLPGRDNLEVVETPEFMRGTFAAGGFYSAPPLEPELGAYLWVTPIPEDWPEDRAEARLREWNYYRLKLLTAHEAVPGHYLQFEYANNVEPEWRRLLRSLFSNVPNYKGWALYATEVMLDHGYLDNSPELRLVFAHQKLGAIAGAIIDIKFHSQGMTSKEAMKLMMEEAFQGEEEARRKLELSRLTATSLPASYVGWRDWRRLRALYEREQGDDFDLAEFHAKALSAGAVPVPLLARILTGKDLGD